MLNRRQINQILLSMSLFPGFAAHAKSQGLKNGSHFNQTPKIGMGTWITFDQNPSRINLSKYIEILNAFFAGGGRMIDSSPMYGSAQQLLGEVLPKTNSQALFAATKVWIPGQQLGIDQMNQSIKLWGLGYMDLMYVHNLMDWKNHLPTLRKWKDQGKIKYYGVTTSHGRRHTELENIIKNEQLDFVQFTYNIYDREAEERLLPLAAERGIQVVINRPFQGGGLFARIGTKPLPDWSNEIQCDTWAQFFLKFIISHPAVNCAIPATSQVNHMRENMLALKGDLPDAKMRSAMIDYFNN